MLCKACGFDHNPMQDCRVAARIRDNLGNETVTKPVTKALPRVESGNEAVTFPVTSLPISLPSDGVVTVSVTHNPYDPTPELTCVERIKAPKTNAQRQREFKARQAAI